MNYGGGNAQPNSQLSVDELLNYESIKKMISEQPTSQLNLSNQSIDMESDMESVSNYASESSVSGDDENATPSQKHHIDKIREKFKRKRDNLQKQLHELKSAYEQVQIQNKVLSDEIRDLKYIVQASLNRPNISKDRTEDSLMENLHIQETNRKRIRHNSPTEQHNKQEAYHFNFPQMKQFSTGNFEKIVNRPRPQNAIESIQPKVTQPKTQLNSLGSALNVASSLTQGVNKGNHITNNNASSSSAQSKTPSNSMGSALNVASSSTQRANNNNRNINNGASSSSSAAQSPKKKAKTPPIIAYEIDQKSQASVIQKTLGHKNFQIEMMNKTCSAIRCSNKEDHKKVVDLLKNSENPIDFHTFTQSEDKKKNIILRKLPPGYNEAEITEAIEELNLQIQVHKVSQYQTDRSSRRGKILPMWLIQLNPGSDAAALLATKGLMNIIVKFEPRKHTDEAL